MHSRVAGRSYPPTLVFLRGGTTSTPLRPAPRWRLAVAGTILMAAAGSGAPAPNAPAVAPPVRLGANVAATRLTRSAAPPNALDPDEWALQRDCPAITSLKYLGWAAPAAGGPALLSVSEVQGICITACTFNLSDGVVLRALRGANLMEHLLSLSACSSILHELHDARVFNATYESEVDFATAVQGSPLVN